MTCHSISRGRDIEALSACIRSSALLIADRLSPIGGARTVHMEKFNRQMMNMPGAAGVIKNCSGCSGAAPAAPRPLAAPWGGRSSYSHCSGAGAVFNFSSFTAYVISTFMVRVSVKLKI